MLLELLVAGQLATYKPNTLVDVKPTYVVVEQVKPLEAPQYAEYAEVAKVSPVIPKPTQRASTKLTQRTTAPAGWYKPGQCTQYVWSRRSVGQWGNASSWPSMARSEGWYVGPAPKAGAIGQRANHVVYVEAVYSSTVLISERNYDFKGSYRQIERPISYFTYIY